MAVIIDSNKCSDVDNCPANGLCIEICALDSINNVNGMPVIDEYLCPECGLCVMNCPNEAISKPWLWKTIKGDNTMVVTIYRDRCNGIDYCPGHNVCIEVCALDAIENVNGYPHINEEACKNCGLCVTNCPNNALSITNI